MLSLIEQFQPTNQFIECASELVIILPSGKIMDVVFPYLFHDPPGRGTILPAIIQCNGTQYIGNRAIEGRPAVIPRVWAITGCYAETVTERESSSGNDASLHPII